jgi:hypothetical protein
LVIVGLTYFLPSPLWKLTSKYSHIGYVIGCWIDFLFIFIPCGPTIHILTFDFWFVVVQLKSKSWSLATRIIEIWHKCVDCCMHLGSMRGWVDQNGCNDNIIYNVNVIQMGQMRLKNWSYQSKNLIWGY